MGEETRAPLTAEIRKQRILLERMRMQKLETLRRAVRHRTYRVRNEDIAEALIRETLPERRKKNGS